MGSLLLAPAGRSAGDAVAGSAPLTLAADAPPPAYIELDGRHAARFQLSRQQLAQRYLEQIRAAIVRYRQTHRRSDRLRGGALDVRDVETYRSTHSDLLGAIQDKFASAGVEILSPSYHAMRNGNGKRCPPGLPSPLAPRPPLRPPAVQGYPLGCFSSIGLICDGTPWQVNTAEQANARGQRSGLCCGDRANSEQPAQPDKDPHHHEGDR